MNTTRSIPGTPPPNSDSHLLGLVAAVMLIVVVVLLWRRDVDPQTSLEAEQIALTQSEILYGIKLEKLSLVSNGAILDFHYRVTDPIKATALAALDDRSYVLTENQIRLDLPPLFSTGPLKSSSNLPRAGQMFFVAVSNPDRHLKPGDRITLVLGNFKASLRLQ